MKSRATDLERIRELLCSLPHTVESATESTHWGQKLVYRVGDREAGGRMFCQIDFEDDGREILSFATDPERFHELLELEGVSPAPYRARLRWVALDHLRALPPRDLESLLRDAHARTLDKLPKKAKARLASSA
jgi:predicted DNA-binding protein (MmcQ/YjbR family)